MVQLKILQNQVHISVDGNAVGEIVLYDNSYHMQHQYLKINLTSLDTRISAEIFQKLFNDVNRPLQVMTESGNEQLIKFITAGGFVCKRKCYEVEATREDYRGGECKSELLHTKTGMTEYILCCKLMYERYVETHRNINPLTADYDSFASDLPSDVFYQEKDGIIIHFAFVHENEIAYIYGKKDADFKSFAEALTNRLFGIYQTICFEADDCDNTAMILKSLFCTDDSVHYDTYVYTKTFDQNIKPSNS